MVLDAAPVPGTTEPSATPAINRTGEPEDHDGQADDETGNRDDGPVIEFSTKKQAFLSRYRGHPQYGSRQAAAQVAAELAPLAGLQAGTGRTYIADELKRIETTAAKNLAIAAPGGDR